MLSSILDNDLYKFTMQRAVLQCHPEAVVCYHFIKRGKIKPLSPQFLERLKLRVEEMSALALTPPERTWLSQFNFFNGDYLDYLQAFRFDPGEVDLLLTDAGHLNLKVRGIWAHTILWEVPLLAMISETYFELIDTQWSDDREAYYDKTLKKGLKLSRVGCLFVDFGTRRRRSYALHEEAVRAFCDLPHYLKNVMSTFTWTSNVYLARKSGIQPIGTMAHEWIMGHAGLYGIRHANQHAFEAWQKVFTGQLGIALTDTYTNALFLLDFRSELAETFEGVRHDSGSPYIFIDDILAHYEKHAIYPMTKKLVFSDSLNVDKAIAIEKYINSRVKTSYGIGTHFTNDIDNSPALDIVIKMIAINNTSVVKISDDIAKATGDLRSEQQAIALIEKAIGATLSRPIP